MFQAINGTHREVLSRAEYIESVKKLAGGDKLEEKLLLAAGEFSLCYYVLKIPIKSQFNIHVKSQEASITDSRISLQFFNACGCILD